MPLESIVPQGLGLAEHDTELLNDQVTAVFVLLLTVAVNPTACAGQPSAPSFGKSVAAEGLTPTVTAGVLFPPPQATRNPAITSARHRLPERKCFERSRFVR